MWVKGSTTYYLNKSVFCKRLRQQIGLIYMYVFNIIIISFIKYIYVSLFFYIGL